MKYLRRPVISFAAALIFLSAAPANADTVVCRLTAIAGFHEEQAKGKEAIGKATTRNVKEIKVYLTHSQKHLFILSNFISKDAEFQTKIVTDEAVDLMTILSNLVFTEQPSDKEGAEFSEALPKIKFVVDPSVENSKYKGLAKEVQELGR